MIISPPSSPALSLAVLRAHKGASLRAIQGALTANLEALEIALVEFAYYENSVVLGLRGFVMDGSEAGD